MNKIMNKKTFFLFFSLLVTMSLMAKKEKIKLPYKYEKWLNEEVVYIISDYERKAFFQMENNRQRDMFIEAFWKNRDPNLSTVENEFKTEHYKRLAYANDKLGRGTPTPGWRTDMGKTYIILGEPSSIKRYFNDTQLYNTEVWFYQGLAKYGLPNGFNLVFFQEYNAGDYKLYSPTSDGPGKLMVNYMGDMTDYSASYRKLYEVEPDLARVSLSLIEGEDQGVRNFSGSPSVSSDILVQKSIPMVPIHRVNDAYARKLVKYKEYIDVDYSANYLNNSYVLRVYRDLDARAFIHYQIAPSKLTMEEVGENLHATLEIIGSISTMDDKIVYQFNKTIPIKINKYQLENIQNQSYAFADMIPIIEGKYKINILMRNVVSKEFTSIEKLFTVPDIKKGEVIMGNPVLCHKLEKQPKYVGNLKPFFFGDTLLIPTAKANFLKGEQVYCYLQLQGLQEQNYENMKLKYQIVKDSYDELKPIITKEVLLKDKRGAKNFVETFTLKDLSPEYYTLRVYLYENDKLKDKKDFLFYISREKQIRRPWVTSLSMPYNSPVYNNIIGKEYLALNNTKKAFEHLKKAYVASPLDVNMALDYCRMLLSGGNYEELKKVSLSFEETKHSNSFSGLLGRAMEKTHDYASAINYYKKFLEYNGANADILNAIGNSYMKLEKYEDALVAYESSKKIMPNQKDLDKKIKELKLTIKDLKKIEKSMKSGKK